MNKIVTGRKLLFVEDNADLRKKLADYFRLRCNEVTEAGTVKEAKNLMSSGLFDAVILDIILPDGEGLDLMNPPPRMPVIILTTLGSDGDILEGFSAGAIDYIVKPCSPEVLEARLSLRLMHKADSLISMHGITINLNERTCIFDGKPILLTGSEFNILHFFMTHAGMFFTSSEIYEHVWHAPSLKTTTIKYHISNLRQKLLTATGKNQIMTEFGKGYAFPKED